MSQHRILNPPNLSSATASWDSILVEKYCLPASESHELSRDCSISILLSQPFELDWRLDSGHLQTTQMSRGDVSITPYGLQTFGRWHDTIECLILSINPKVVERVAAKSTNTSNIEIAPQRGVRDAQIYHIGLALLAELEAGFLSGCLYGESLSLALAVHLIERYSTSSRLIQKPVGGLSYRKLKQVTDYINDNLAQALKLSEIATSIGMSPYHFARLFKQSTGLSPHQYVIQCRIEQAKVLLAENKLPIIEIAYRIGCSSQSNFTALFRKHVGITPKGYREQTKM